MYKYAVTGDLLQSSLPPGSSMSSCPISGHGSFEFPDGDKYTGEWLNSKPHGQGRFEFRNGNLYVGTFRNGLRHGKGVHTWARGNKYEGDYVNDKMHGKGVFTSASGNKYEGDYVNDKMHGKGVFTSDSGNKYEGDYVDGKMHGKGVFTFPNGDTYEGAFVNGDFHGKGSFKFKVDGQHSYALGRHSFNAGDEVDGVFERKKLHGKCIYTFFTGEKFECTFVEGRCPEFDARQADVRAKVKEVKAAAEAKAAKYRRVRCALEQVQLLHLYDGVIAEVRHSTRTALRPIPSLPPVLPRTPCTHIRARRRWTTIPSATWPRAAAQMQYKS
jgi:hypothetical protein